MKDNPRKWATLFLRNALSEKRLPRNGYQGTVAKVQLLRQRSWRRGRCPFAWECGSHLATRFGGGGVLGEAVVVPGGVLALLVSFQVSRHLYVPSTAHVARDAAVAGDKPAVKHSVYEQQTDRCSKTMRPYLQLPLYLTKVTLLPTEVAHPPAGSCPSNHPWLPLYLTKVAYTY